MSLIRVFEIPPPLHEYVFEGRPQEFINVDWFRDDSLSAIVHTRDLTRDEWEIELRKFIAKKAYFQRGRPLLVLGDKWSFTINYEAR
jgi:hypothetical protein